MSYVDALSRIVSMVKSLPLERQLKFRQPQDGKLQSIAENLKFTNNDKFKLVDRLVF